MIEPSAGPPSPSKSKAPCSSPMKRKAAPGGAPRSATGLPLSVAKAFQPAFTTTRPGLFADTTVAATNSEGAKGLSFSEMLITP